MMSLLNKNYIFLVILCLTLFFCSKNRNSTEMKYDGYPEYKKIMDRILTQTKNKILKKDIKNLLLYNKGIWVQTSQTKFIFHKNGKLTIYFGGRVLFRMYWKIKNNNLFINPNKNESNYGIDPRIDGNKYYKMRIKPASSFSYPGGPSFNKNKYLKLVKYAIELKTYKMITTKKETKNILSFTLRAYKKDAF